MKNLIFLLIVLILTACSNVVEGNTQEDSMGTMVLTKTVPPTTESTTQLFVEELPENISGELQIHNSPEYGVRFQKTVLWGFDWLNDNERLVGAISLSGIEEDIDEVYLWNPLDDSYTRLSSGKTNGFRTFMLVNPIDDRVLYGYVSLVGEQFQEYKDEPTGMWVVDPNGGEAELLVENVMGAWHTEKERIITDSFEIFDLETEEFYEFAELVEFQWIIEMEVSPTGEFLAFIGQDTISENLALYLYSLKTSEILVLGEADRLSVVEWSSNGEYLLFLHDGLIAIEIDKGCKTSKLSLPMEIGGFKRKGITRNIAWSPDGGTLAIGGRLDEVGAGIFFIETTNDFFQSWLSSGNCEN